MKNIVLFITFLLVLLKAKNEQNSVGWKLTTTINSYFLTTFACSSV